MSREKVPAYLKTRLLRRPRIDYHQIELLILEQLDRVRIAGDRDHLAVGSYAVDQLLHLGMGLPVAIEVQYPSSM